MPRAEGDTVSMLPISALISQALVAFGFAYEEMSGVALSWSATVINRLTAEARMAKELCASPVALSGLERHGYLRSENGTSGPTLRLTAKGRAIKDAFNGRVFAVEHVWRTMFGDDDVTALRSALENAADTTASVSQMQPESPLRE